MVNFVSKLEISKKKFHTQNITFEHVYVKKLNIPWIGSKNKFIQLHQSQRIL